MDLREVPIPSVCIRDGRVSFPDKVSSIDIDGLKLKPLVQTDKLRPPLEGRLTAMLQPPRRPQREQ